jgi:hypothetical protein
VVGVAAGVTGLIPASLGTLGLALSGSVPVASLILWVRIRASWSATANANPAERRRFCAMSAAEAACPHVQVRHQIRGAADSVLTETFPLITLQVKESRRTNAPAPSRTMSKGILGAPVLSG